MFLKADLLKFEKFVVIGIFSIITFLYYHDTLNNWFIFDDAAAIYYSMEPLKEIFFGINYSHAFYTPLVNLSFKPDVMFFGLKPLPYHIHNTLVLVLISFMAYQILRLYRDRVSSFLASIVILFTTPALVCLEWVTLRQYLYSMLFSLMTVYFFLKYKPDPKNNKLIVFIILTLCELSFMGKEQFMTLPFILFIISEGNFKNRMSKVYPYFILLAGHFILRIYVLEGLGGYLGFKYNTIVYLRTTIGSIFTASKILFGYNWFVVPVAIPLLKRPKKILLSIILWLTSLSISFFTMYTYPEIGSFRYWFMPAVLFSFLIGFSAGFVKNTLLKYLYFLTIIPLLILHSNMVNKDVRTFFKNESLYAEKITNLLLDNRHLNNIILILDDYYTYLEHMLKNYAKIANVQSFSAFFPVEMIAFYPEIGRNFEKIYEVRKDVIIDISDSIEKKIAEFNKDLSKEKPKIKLFRKDNKVEASFQCNSASTIVAYKKIKNAQYISKEKHNYFEYIRLNPIIKLMESKDVKLVDIEKLSYQEKKWYIEGRSVDDNVSFYVISCLDINGKSTSLSNVLYFLP